MRCFPYKIFKLKGFIYVLFLIMGIGCSKPNVQEQIYNINGYWEIERVKFPNGSVKDYTVSFTIDYIEIKDSIGFRIKLQPGIDGSFSKSDDKQQVVLKLENDSLRLYYSTPFYSWKETVILVKDSTLVLLNENKTVYTYRRFKPLNLN